MVQSGKIDEKMLKDFTSGTLGKTSTGFTHQIGKMDNKELSDQVDKETGDLLKNLGGSFSGGEGDNILLKNLEAEVKFLTYKLKQSQKQNTSSTTGGQTTTSNDSSKTISSPKNKIEEIKSPRKDGKIETPIEIPTLPGDDGPPPPPPGGDDGPPPPPNLDKPKGPILPELPKIKAKIPMKGIFWTAVSVKQISNSVWLKKDLTKNLSEIKFDSQELENLFGAKKKILKKKKKKNNLFKELHLLNQKNLKMLLLYLEL